jgi:DNA-binding response OmpR family regulator
MIISMTMPQSRRCCATVGGMEVRVMPHMAAVLERLLLARPGMATHEELISAVWPHPDDEPEAALRQIQMYVTWLRAKGIPVLGTWGRGYSLPDVRR